MSLRWSHDPRRDLYTARCGSQLQGMARVWLHADGWRWALDMLPEDQEPVIRSTVGYATAEEAIGMVEAQAVIWPVLVREAVR
ncbi:hypothetical protein GXW77_13720 [Roseomonas alkaliterrae]|jgi:hypothetical protein|uniref:hypothetical protein n=1 Tax=Neoroseomonas alkaliterrae TaxID=1452450 RepID=UPI001BAD1457|nr:hypothetical protein [Neoroseomonas alkaliterrae]MBR0677235.1 hypothetical protein [Neoroseomonas alkaliterrae]